MPEVVNARFLYRNDFLDEQKDRDSILLEAPIKFNCIVLMQFKFLSITHLFYTVSNLSRNDRMYADTRKYLSGKIYTLNLWEIWQMRRN